MPLRMIYTWCGLFVGSALAAAGLSAIRDGELSGYTILVLGTMMLATFGYSLYRRSHGKHVNDKQQRMGERPEAG